MPPRTAWMMDLSSIKSYAEMELTSSVNNENLSELILWISLFAFSIKFALISKSCSINIVASIISNVSLDSMLFTHNFICWTHYVISQLNLEVVHYSLIKLFSNCKHCIRMNKIIKPYLKEWNIKFTNFFVFQV